MTPLLPNDKVLPWLKYGVNVSPQDAAKRNFEQAIERLARCGFERGIGLYSDGQTLWQETDDIIFNGAPPKRDR